MKKTTAKQRTKSNIEGQGFHTNPERINRNGRPRKYYSSLKEQGYKMSEINDTLMVLLSMDLNELKEVFENPKATVLEKAVAGAIRKSIEKGSLYNIETIITRAMGKPREQMEIVHTIEQPLFGPGGQEPRQITNEKPKEGV